LTANIESLICPSPRESFDVLIAGRFSNIWSTVGGVAAAADLSAPRRLVMGSSPDRSPHSVIWVVAEGDWTLADIGRIDRPHLRWLTPRSSRALASKTEVQGARE